MWKLDLIVDRNLITKFYFIYSILPERAYLFSRNLPILSEEKRNIVRETRLKIMMNAIGLDFPIVEDLQVHVETEKN